MHILISIFIFISVTAVSYLLYPFSEKRFIGWRKKRIEKLTPELDKMFIKAYMKKILLIDIISPLALAVLVFFITKIFWMALLSALGGVALTNFIIKQMEQNRRKKFANQLVDGLMLLSGSLKAGLSLIQSFEALIEEMPVPISQEFSLVVRENRMGVPLEECLAKLKYRMMSEELDMVITAMLVARETGGDLTTIFSNLVMTIRERNRLLGRAKALCTQGSLQGKIMIALPVVFAYAVYKLDPKFFSTLLNDPMGKTLLGYAVISEIIGAILIVRLSKVDI